MTRLNGILLPALQSASVRERYAAGGSEPVWSTPDAYAAFIRNEIGKWGKVVKQAGLKPE